MITQETKLVKTWGGFNLTILKVKSKSTKKNQSSYNKTYKPPQRYDHPRNQTSKNLGRI